MRLFFALFISFFIASSAYAQSPTFDTGASDANELTTTGIADGQVVYDSAGTLTGDTGLHYDSAGNNELYVGGAVIEHNAPTAKTADYTFVLGDDGVMIRFNSSGNLTATVPTNASVAYPTGSWLQGAMWGGGTLTFSSGGSVTLNGSLSFSSAGFALHKIGSDEWDVYGGS